MDNLVETVKQELLWYQTGGAQAHTFVVFDDDRKIYSVLAEDEPPRQNPAMVVIVAQVVGDKVIIREDVTDRPVYKHLMQMGIPREQIICAYLGEAVPSETPTAPKN